MRNVFKKSFYKIAKPSVNEFIYKNKNTLFPRNSIFFSEGFAFCVFSKMYSCDVIIESGVRYGGSTRMILNYFDNDVTIHSNDLLIQHKEDVENTIENISLEYPSRSWSFHPGKGEEVVYDLAKSYQGTGKRIAIMIDGPKYKSAVDLSRVCLQLDEVKFVSIHDMGQIPYKRLRGREERNSIEDIRGMDNHIFNTDALWYRKKFADRIDDEICGANPSKDWGIWRKKYLHGCGLSFLINPKNEKIFASNSENIFYSK